MGPFLCVQYLLRDVFVLKYLLRHKGNAYLAEEQSIIVFEIKTRCLFDVDHGRDDFLRGW